MNSFLKPSLVAAAVTAALGSTAALAIAPSTTPNYVIYIGGGSAEQNPVFVASCRILSNVDVITDSSSGAASGDYQIAYGTLTNNLASNGTVATGSTPVVAAAGSNVLLVYKLNGGSYNNGVAPQSAAGGTLPYPTQAAIQSATAISGRTAGTSCTTGKPTYSFTLGTLSNPQQPDFGISDVEAGLFQGVINNPSFPAASISVAKADLLYDLVEGVAVTDVLYQLKKNWSRAEVAGILSGAYTDFSQILADSGSALPAAPIILIDRNTGSGTKAAGNQYFLGFPGFGASYLTPESVSFGYTGSLVATQTLQDVSDTSTTAQAADLGTANAAGLYAITVMSMDAPPVLNQKVAGKNSYDFVKINGIAVDSANGGNDDINGSVGTSYVNAITGNYDFFYQPNFNYRNASTLWTTTTSAPRAIDEALLLTFQSTSFAGVSFSGNATFPLAAPGTLTDCDRASLSSSTPVAGVTYFSRSGNSQQQLAPCYTTGTATTLVLGSDEL